MDLESGTIRRRRSCLPQPGNESGVSCWKKVVDPWDPDFRKWNIIFAVISVVSVFIDPWFLYITVYDNSKKCIDVDYELTIFLCALRLVLDLFYYYDVILQFIHHSKSEGFHAILAALPLLQVASSAKADLLGVFIMQFATRFRQLVMIYAQISMIQYPWLPPKLFPRQGVVVNMLICMLASNVLGALWYHLTIGAVTECWRKACVGHHCDPLEFNCIFQQTGGYSFLKSSCPLLEPNEIKQPSDYNFGMYLEALQSGLLDKQNHVQRIIYGFGWGLRNLSSFGQSIKTSNSIGQTVFVIFISITGLYMFALLFNSIQNGAKSALANDMKEKALRQDIDKIEQWMSSRMLPDDLRHWIREYVQHKVQKTRSINKEDVEIKNLPVDLRRNVTKHLCGHILIKVLMFAKMDEWLRNALCDHLEHVTFTDNKYICREGDPVDKMLFFTRGNILSTSTNGGRRISESFDLSSKGQIWGMELIPWAFESNSCSSTLPASTLTIQNVEHVEGFALMADDLRFLANQFRNLNINEVQHILRFSSLSWRRRSARFIQAVWRHNRWKKRDKSARFIQAVWRHNRWKKRDKSARFIQAAWHLHRRKKHDEEIL